MQFCKDERGWRSRKKMERRVDVGAKASRLYQAAPLISAVWGASCVLPIQRGSSSLFDLGPAFSEAATFFFGPCRLGIFHPTRHRLQRRGRNIQRSGSRTVNSHSLHCVHVCLGRPECTTDCRMGTKTGFVPLRNSRRALSLDLGSRCRTTAAARGRDPLLILRRG